MSDNDVEQEEFWGLRPKARIMRAIGDELISSELVAISELVKNSYDADATRVLIRFEEPLEKGKGKVMIMDDGHGMSLDTIRTTWLEPATSFKRKRRKSKSGNRRMLGEKGLGRFGASRLADDLLVISREPETPTEALVYFDWSQFDDDDKYLEQVEIIPEEIEPTDIKKGGDISKLWDVDQSQPSDEEISRGTILLMKGLRINWTRQDFVDLRTKLSRLVSPFANVDFEIFLQVPNPNSDLSGIIEPSDVFQHPLYQLDGIVNEYGEYKLSIKALGEEVNIEGVTPDIPKNYTDFKKNDMSNELFKTNCGGFSLSLRAWDKDSESLKKLASEFGTSVRDIRRDLNEIGGISVYRDGFRVLPYGEQGNDWLRLDNRRIQNPGMRIGNDRIAGYVSINSENNPELSDLSNREGIVDSLALKQFKYLITSMLAELEKVRYSLRHKDSPPKPSPGSIFKDFDLNAVYNYVVNRYPEDDELKRFVSEQKTELDKRVKAAQDVIGRYRRLATLGQIVDAVLHEGRPLLLRMANQLEDGLEITKQIDESDCVKSVSRIYAILEEVSKRRDNLTTVFRRIEPFGGRRRGRPKEVIFEHLVRESFAIFAGDLRRSNIKVTYPESEHNVTVDSAEIQEVFINLILNSIYWLNEMPKDSRQILVTVNQYTDGELEVIFSDSGPGVKDLEHPDIIFHPYFSLKPNGTGLGLNVVGEIVYDYYDGEVLLLEDGPLSGLTFRILFKRRV